MNYKVNDNAQRNQTKTGKNHFCYIYNKVYGGNHQQKPLPASSSNSVGVAIPQPRVAGAARYPGYIYN